MIDHAGSSSLWRLLGGLAIATQAMIAENRARYEVLKTAAEGETPRALPVPTLRDSVPLAVSASRHREIISGGWYWTKLIRRGEVLRIVNTSGTYGVSLFAWNANDKSERYNSADTDRFKRPVLEADESVRAESALGKLPRHRGDYRRLQGGGR